MAFVVATHALVVTSLVIFGLTRGKKEIEPIVVSCIAIGVYLLALLVRYILLVGDNFADFSAAKNTDEGRLNAEFRGYTGTR